MMGQHQERQVSQKATLREKPMATAQTVQAARRHFIEGGVPSGDLVPPPILRSWERCATLGLEMLARPRIEPMTAPEMRELRERCEALRRICRPEIEALHADAQATESIVILTDADGLVIDTVGSVDFAEHAARVALRPGVHWSEAATGTNAIGTALVERRPIAVHGAEHFFEMHRILSCAAVPILDPRGALVGALDLSGHAAGDHRHALGLVRLAADQIEHRLFEHGFEDQEVVRIHRDPALLGTAREGLLVFADHRLVAANRHGLDQLGLDWRALGERSFEDLFETTFARQASSGYLRARDGALLHGERRPAQSRPARLAVARPHSGHQPPAASEPIFDATTKTALARAVRLVDAEIPVLLQGETGTGKEIFARASHAASARGSAPFVAVNCAALPEGLIEAELFGYEEGAFTGARRRGAKGLLREAEGGVLFLDEIGDMPLLLQSRLLRVLQDRTVAPLGGGRAVPVDFAVICATHRDLRRSVTEGKFREDLYFRIAQYTVELPPLRRLPDRAALVRGLWRRLKAEELGVTLTPECEAQLAFYDWPGNFRQLTGTLRALAALAEPGRPIGRDALPPELRDAAPSADVALGTDAATPTKDLDSITNAAIRAALDECQGNVSRAARRLRVHRSTIYRRLAEEGVEQSLNAVRSGP
jgi:transcriptional regulator of acetoin/glycerol metabolism